MIRRRRGSTLSLVVLVFLLLVMNGIAAYFLISIFGGGREVANLTDAGALNVAKQSVTVSVPTTNYPEFQDLVYPYTPGGTNNAPGITLLTYNRCVAKALIVAYNASEMEPPSQQAITDAQHVIKDLNSLASDLKTALSNPKQLYTNFNTATITANNHTRMWGNNTVSPQSGSLSFMKADGPTNVYFNTQAVPGLFTQPSSQFNIPTTNTKMAPKDIEQVPQNAVGGYMPGYADLVVNGVTGTGGPNTHIYGVPVFPQITPHLVALADFLIQQKPVSDNLPPNAFRIDTSCNVNKTGSVGGAVACAIVGDAYAATGGITGPGATIGNGMEFAAALPSGYIEFDNTPALAPPPNYSWVQTVMTSNIFNNELGLYPQCPNTTGYMQTGGNNFFLSQPQYSTIVCFSQDSQYLFSWIAKAKFDTTPWAILGFTDPGTPPDLTNGVYVGPINTDLSNPANLNGQVGVQPIHQYSKLTKAQKDWLGACWSVGMYPQNTAFQGGNTMSAINCVNYLNTEGLKDYCVAAIGTMCQTYHHPVPPSGVAAPQLPITNDFSVVDYAKSQLLIDFMTPDTSANAPGAPQGIGNNNPPPLTIPASQASGVGVFNFMQNNTTQPVPKTPPDTPTPVSQFAGSTDMPVERIGSIYDLLREVQSSACMQDTINKITIACQQVQPTTTQPLVVQLLQNTPLPMGTAGGAASKVYFYLKNADLSKPLIANSGPPPGNPVGGPDGNTQTGACYANTYNIDQNLVDAGHDMGLHIRPYTQVSGSLTATDSILYTPGSGYNNCLGKFIFQETGSGTSTFVHIN